MAADETVRARRKWYVNRIAQYLLDEIANENLESGDMLPSTKEILAKFRTNTGVVCAARKILIEKGIIRVEVGGERPGTYVA